MIFLLHFHDNLGKELLKVMQNASNLTYAARGSKAVSSWGALVTPSTNHVGPAAALAAADVAH